MIMHQLFLACLFIFCHVKADETNAASKDFCVLENIEVHALFAVDCSSSLTDGDFNVAMKFASNVTKFMGKVSSTLLLLLSLLLLLLLLLSLSLSLLLLVLLLLMLLLLLLLLFLLLLANSLLFATLQIESTRPAKMGVIQFSTQVFTMVPLATPSNWTILARNLTFSHIHDRIRNKTLIAETNTEIALQHIGDLLDRERNKT